jgi:hypothetical protein
MKHNLLFKCTMVLIAIFGFNACEEDAKAPTGEFTFVVDGSEVVFTSVVTDTDTYLWDFGDDVTSTEASPTHTYLVSGTYTVTLTVKGEGGEIIVSHDVDILPSFDEMLTGGPTATNGKTWVLSRAYNEGVDGGSGVEPSMFLIAASAPDILDGIGLGSEYDNEFTFYSDGKYEIDIKNDEALTAVIFGLVNGVYPGVNYGTDLGLVTTNYTAPENSTWTLNETDLIVSAAAFGATDVPAVRIPVTFTGLKWISLSEGAYFGILDFPTTRQFIVKSLTPESLSVALFICAYEADPCDAPTLMYHLTFVPKP